MAELPGCQCQSLVRPGLEPAVEGHQSSCPGEKVAHGTPVWGTQNLEPAADGPTPHPANHLQRKECAVHLQRQPPAHVIHMPPSIRSQQSTMSAHPLDAPGHKQAQSTGNQAEQGVGKSGHTCRDRCGRSALKDDAVHLIGWVLTRRAHGLSRTQDLRVLGQELLLAGPRDGDSAVVLLLAGRALHGVKLHPRAVALDKRAELRAALLDQVEVDDGGCDLQGWGRGLGAAGADWSGRRWCECRCRCRPVY